MLLDENVFFGKCLAKKESVVFVLSVTRTSFSYQPLIRETRYLWGISFTFIVVRWSRSFLGLGLSFVFGDNINRAVRFFHFEKE